ncbi:endo alpha-1,4 polygalactosaminidase [Candidatus Kaiserbacteria bacterium]|nr:endo alpha-1,4 polygalactosaminidase [Candidatus Kaiserbacteria bacterium]
MDRKVLKILLGVVAVVVVSTIVFANIKQIDDTETLTGGIEQTTTAPASSIATNSNPTEDSTENSEESEIVKKETIAQNVTSVDTVTASESESTEVQTTKRSESIENTNWWKPHPNTSWQWQLTGTLNQNYAVDMYDVDLFDNSKKAIRALQTKGIKVICYFSAGSYEDWRIDKGDFPNKVKGDTLEGWANERWLDISKIDLLAPIMESRLDLAVEKGCDGVEPDNVDGYLNDTGLALTYQDQLTYNKWLAGEAHKKGLAIGLKNDLEQIPELVDYFDFALNEQCFEYDECETLLPFIEQNKAVFGVEYELHTKKFCNEAIKLNFDWLKMEYDLDGGRISCR